MLKELLGEDLFKQVSEKIGDKKLIVNDGNYIPIDKFNEINESKKEYKKQLEERDKQLSELKTKATGNEELTKQFEELKLKNEEATKQYEAKIAKQTFDFKLEAELMKAKGKNTKAIKALLDESKIIVDGDNLIGLDDQLKALQTSDAYLFGETTPIGSGTNPPGGGNLNPDIDKQIADAINAGNNVLAISLKNKKYNL